MFVCLSNICVRVCPPPPSLKSPQESSFAVLTSTLVIPAMNTCFICLLNSDYKKVCTDLKRETMGHLYGAYDAGICLFSYRTKQVVVTYIISSECYFSPSVQILTQCGTRCFLLLHNGVFSNRPFWFFLCNFV